MQEEKTSRLTTSNTQTNIKSEIKIRSKRDYKKRYLREEEIKKSICCGAKSLEEISFTIGLSIGHTRRLAKEAEIKIPKKQYESKPAIDALINKGLVVREIAEQLGISKSTVYRYIDKSNQKEVYYKRKRSKQDNPIDDLIKKGFAAREIAEQLGISRQAVYYYLDREGIKEIYRQKRRINDFAHSMKKPEKKMLGVRLAATLEQIAKQKLQKGDEDAFDSSIAYFRLTKGSSCSFKRIFTLFKRYYDAKKTGKKASLREIGLAPVNMFGSGVDCILSKLNKEPLYGKKQRKNKVSEEQIEAIGWCYEIDMSYADIGYFLGLPQYVVYQRIAKSDKSIQIPGRTNYLAFFGLNEKLTHKICSQIYEAQDCEFSKEEILELLDISKRVYDYAIQHKQTLEPIIINALRTMFPNKEINKPYREFKI